MANPDDDEWNNLLRQTMAANKPKPSKAESAVRGVAQGFTSGWGDEIGAAIDTGVSKIPGVRNVAQMLHDDKLPPIDDPTVPYATRRDAYRGNNAAAQQENPGTYRAGEVGGGVAQMAAPGVKALNAAGPVARVVGNAALGGAGGAGFSDQVGAKLAKDTIKGAGVGATVGALSTVAGTGGTSAAAGRTAAQESSAGGSAARSNERVFTDIGRAAGAKAQERLEQMGPEYVARVARKHGLVEAPDPRIPAQAAQQKLGAQIGEAYKAIDGAGLANGPSMNAPGPVSTVSPAAIGDALGAMESKLSKRYATQPMAAEIAKVRQGLVEKYPNGIPLSDLNAEIGAIQADGFSGSLVAPTVGAKLKRATAHALDEVMNNALATIKKERPQAARAIDALPELNKEYAALKTINDVYKKRIPRERFKAPDEMTLTQKATAPIKGAATAVDEGMAAGLRAIPGGQTASRGVAAGARALSPAVIDHMRQGNMGAAIAQVGTEIYGDE